MGNSQSPSSDPRFDSASRAFTQKELEDLKFLFESLAAQSHSNCQFISPSVFKVSFYHFSLYALHLFFSKTLVLDIHSRLSLTHTHTFSLFVYSIQEYFGLCGPLADRMFNLVTQNRNDQELTFEDLVIAKGTYEKGNNDEVEEFIFQLLDANGDGCLGRADLEAVLTAMLDCIFSPINSESGSSSHQDIVEVFVSAATFSKHDDGCAESSMSFKDFRSWCTLLPSVRKFLGSLLIPPDPGKPSCQVPHLLHMEGIDSNVIILRKEYAWHIGGFLMQQELEEWKLLYHSAFNGLSFTTFLGNISNDMGPTVLVIKDKEGNIYGGYASQPWERHSDFYGDMKSCLFQLYPKASIFRPTGANRNLQWCAVNFTSESIPNGIGFGGQVNHFGLFLSASFDHGQTFNSPTFGNPCLSKTNKIFPEVIECWGIVSKGLHQGSHDTAKGTVLERFKEDRNMLNLVGLANSSE